MTTKNHENIYISDTGTVVARIYHSDLWGRSRPKKPLKPVEIFIDGELYHVGGQYYLVIWGDLEMGDTEVDIYRWISADLGSKIIGGVHYQDSAWEYVCSHDIGSSSGLPDWQMYSQNLADFFAEI